MGLDSTCMGLDSTGMGLDSTGMGLDSTGMGLDSTGMGLAARLDSTNIDLVGLSRCRGLDSVGLTGLTVIEQCRDFMGLCITSDKDASSAAVSWISASSGAGTRELLVVLGSTGETGGAWPEIGGVWSKRVIPGKGPVVIGRSGEMGVVVGVAPGMGVTGVVVVMNATTVTGVAKGLGIATEVGVATEMGVVDRTG